MLEIMYRSVVEAMVGLIRRATSILFLVTSAMLAQAPRTAVSVRVEVRDSVGMAVPDVAVFLDAPGAHASARGVTSDRGVVTLKIARADRYVTSLRKVGFRPVDSTFVSSADSLALRLTMSRIPAALDTVRVRASETAKQRAYHIGAAEIGSTSRVLIDAFDIVAKLRPDIAWGRGACAGASNIWVNGRWIAPQFVLKNDIANSRANGGGAAGHVSRTVLYVLSEIKPEHIEEMTYHDCFDTSVPGPHGQAALIVTLKTGVRYDPGRGSYVVK